MSSIYVGMSGGVDSSLTAALLTEEGHSVTGVYMKNWTADLPGMHCPWADDLADAKRVAVQLGIDFKVYDFENDYKAKVVENLISEYKAGRTPNPDVMCNQEIKFKLFVETAIADGAEMIATGHYARVSHEYGVGTSSCRATRRGVLRKAVDEGKDQTYFLYRTTEIALAKTLFPLGNYTKPCVRQMAKARGLFTADKKDSQGICFVGQIGIREFLSQYVTPQQGNIIDKRSGDVIGEHDGAIFYTLGQRHGLSLGGGLPYYVVGKNMDKNELYVSRALDDAALWKKIIRIGSMHWINEMPIEGRFAVRIRHRAPLVDAMVTLLDDDMAVLELSEPQRAVTAGQSVVIYDGDICLGGGIVVSSNFY